VESTVAAAVCAAVCSRGIITMTKDEHKARIVQQLQQETINLLVEALASAQVDVEQLKVAAADKPAP